MKSNKGLFRLFAGIAAASLMLMTLACTTEVAGPIEVGNPAVVTGTVINLDNTGVDGAYVFLVTPDYNAVTGRIPPLDSMADTNVLVGQMVITGDGNRYSAITNQAGAYLIRSVPRRTYNLFVTDPQHRRLAFRTSVAVDNDSVNLGSDIARSICYGNFTITNSMYVDSGFLTVPGTPLKQEVDSAGTYALPLPAANVVVFYVNRNGDTVAALTDTTTIKDIIPGDTLDLTGAENIIIPPLLAVFYGGFMRTMHSDDTVAVSDSSLTIEALWAVSSKNHPLEYQFSWQPGPVFTAWSADSSIRIGVNPNTTYRISCRARSAKDHNAVSDWTSQYSLFVRRSSLTDDTLAAPAAPRVALSILRGDSLIVTLATSPVQSLGGKALVYRFGWARLFPDTIITTVSPWSTDTNTNVCIIRLASDTIAYRFHAQARGAQSDSLLVSPWSAATIFSYP
jgi:hypothetical protein